LERSGHLRISPGDDRRKRVASLTEQGRTSLEHAVPLWQRAQQELRQELGGEKWEVLFAGLHGLAHLPRRETCPPPGIAGDATAKTSD
jgi:DNA-binding MarR family transcriptional regulator